MFTALQIRSLVNLIIATDVINETSTQLGNPVECLAYKSESLRGVSHDGRYQEGVDHKVEGFEFAVDGISNDAADVDKYLRQFDRELARLIQRRKDLAIAMDIPFDLNAPET